MHTACLPRPVARTESGSDLCWDRVARSFGTDRQGGLAEMARETEAIQGAQSLHRSLHLLRLVSSRATDGIRIADLCRQSGMARTTVHRMLQALQSEGLIEQDPDNDRYFLGREAWLLGVAAESRVQLSPVAHATLASLSEASGDISLFLLRTGAKAVCIAREEGSYPVRTHTAQVGGRYPLGVGGGSLAILAACDDAEIEWLLEVNEDELRRNHPDFTPDSLRALIVETRTQGYAINPGRVYPESWGVAVPFFDPQKICRGAISIAGVPNRIRPRIRDIVKLLKAEVPKLERGLYGKARP